MKVVGILVLVLNIALVYPVEIAIYEVLEVTNQSVWNPQTRIYGGEAAREGQFPFMIFALMVLSPTKISRCTASLIGTNWVLLAAHCVDLPYLSHKNIILVGGKANLQEYINVKLKNLEKPIDEMALKVQERRAKEFFIHPEYNTHTIYHDIALIQLEAPFTLDYITTIPLSYDKIRHVMSCTALGWGITPTDENNFKLNYIQDEMVSTTELGCSYKSSGPFICLIRHTSGICKGDSGGPLICNGKVWGVASHYVFGDDPSCGHSFEDYYAEVYPDIKWIKKYLNSGNPSAVINLKNMLVLSGLWLLLKSWMDVY